MYSIRTKNEGVFITSNPEESAITQILLGVEQAVAAEDDMLAMRHLVTYHAYSRHCQKMPTR
ncbi:MAG: hypothetical protein HN725_21245 [Alphaproteobacteria bacterium]|jgi:hypothetical protein|nr:hypothetical protein [Alphaproteobacteria bacterium]MBT4086774.1 hypothetical protein [Alphaproteobacteria bacterium]MBT4542228.1 hypothetical protein [Alphaproteobacteria bacterium]MBT5162014.1 hypothetical protein [Alphaproteobacteria bacterium]MBT6385070.1 hypothetical protein [Alphaproteobacteria bacterium]